MIRFRPLAGAALLSLLLIPVAFADRVEVITPGGNASLTPPGSSGTRPTDVVVDVISTQGPTAATGSGTSYSPAEAVEAQPGLQTRHFGGVTLSCTVASSTKDLVVINQSLEPLPPGTRIKWQLKQGGKRGFFAIIGELRGGEALVADDVVEGGAGQDEICVARVI